ncbi:MAG: XrtA system polysaccharide deacetylase [Thermodesulfobacteriota bacterium]
MINALSFDIEDWFQVENLKSAISYEDWDHLELRVVRNTELILRILKDSDTKATFFVLGWVAERCPELVEEISSGGHEIASHGFSHRLVYDMTEASFAQDIRRAKDVLEEITKKRVLGYRAPSFSITKESLWALDILKDEGHTYDSSIFPVSFHDRYGFAGCSDRPFSWPNGLAEIPLSVYRVRGLTLPLAGGGYFRLLPYAYFKFFLKRLNRNQNCFTFYLHPWEFDPGQPRIDVPLGYRFRHYINLKFTEKYLRRLLTDFSFDRLCVAHGLEP